tara:strand:- start:4548 stop:7700 length:3153 start_codon:yes stop_codon:yes gene_type:complete
MYKIAHVSDTHIRNLKYHYEYDIAFKDLYKKLKRMKPDIIVHTGDIAHTKTQLSPEFFQMCSGFLYNLGEIAPTYIILGNHDGNLKNDTRQDAISPIVEALNHDNLHLLKSSGEAEVLPGLTLNVLSVFDRDNWSKPSNENNINIALYHGSIHGCQTSQGYVMTEAEDSVNIFEDFDFAMLGDIHKAQSMDIEGRVRYAGSTIQQNFGESIDKGFLMWNIKSKNNFSAQHVSIVNPRPFITIKLNNDGTFPKVTIPKGCRLRIKSSSNISPIKLKMACDLATAKWSPISVSFMNDGTNNAASTSLIGKAVKSENLRDVAVQEKHIRAYCKDLNLKDEVMNKILELNKKYNKQIEENEEVSRNVIWKIKEIEWDNLFNYGEKNKVNFEKLSGLVGIFGKNYSGKSSIVDSVLYSIFNTTSKGERKNVHIINQNKDYAKCKIKLEAGHDSFEIRRNLNKYTKKSKGRETVEAKVDLDFSKTTGGVVESLNGTTRNQSDANIRKRFGNIDDFFLTSMASQLDSMSFIKEGSTKRKEIVAKFLDLDIFEQKNKLARKDAADIRAVIKRMESKKFEERIKKKSDLLEDIRMDIDEQIDKCKIYENSMERFDKELAEISKTIDAIPAEIINIDEVNKKIHMKKRQKNKLLANNLSLLGQVKECESLVKEFNDLYCEERYEELVSYQQRIKELNVAKSSIDNKVKSQKTIVKNLQKRVKLLENHEYDPNCQYCINNEFVKEAHKAEGKLPEALKTLQDLSDSSQKLSDNLQSYDTIAIEEEIITLQDLKDNNTHNTRSIEKNKLIMSQHVAKIDLLSNEVSTLETKAKEYEDNKDAIENKGQLYREQAALLTKVKDMKNSLKKCNELTKEYLIEEAAVKQAIKSLYEEKNEFKEMQEEWVAYDTFINCMHPNGISYEIIQQKLPVINGEVAKVLANIVDFEVFFENDDKKLEIYIKHPNYGKRPLSMGSGAEKTIASMAIRLAMIAITNLPKSELFILDEPATALDQEHMEGFVRLLGMIKNQFKTVLLISHLDNLKDVVDMTIDIDKLNGYAKVNI